MGIVNNRDIVFVPQTCFSWLCLYKTSLSHKLALFQMAKKKDIKVLHGNFSVSLYNFSVSLYNGIFKSLLFKIAQHEKDEVLLIAIKDYLNCGYCYLRKKRKHDGF